MVDLDEQPLEGVEVAVRMVGQDLASSEHGPDQGDPHRAVSDAQGRFVLRDLPAVRLDIHARSTGFAPLVVRGVELPPGRRPVDLGTLMLEPGVTIRGSVADPEGQPIAGAEVWRTPADQGTRLGHVHQDAAADTRTGEDGRFELVDLAPGTRLDLAVDADGFLPARVRGVEAPTAEPVVLLLRPAASVRGRVENADGEPVAGAEVNARLVSEAVENFGDMSVVTDDAGRFALADLMPGAVAIEAWAQGYQPSEPEALELEARQEIEDVVLVLEPGAVLEGFVSTLDGDPVAGARVLVGRAAATAGDDGAYRVAGIPPGQREAEVRHPSYNRMAREVEIELGINRADFELAGGHAVAGPGTRARGFAGGRRRGGAGG